MSAQNGLLRNHLDHMIQREVVKRGMEWLNTTKIDAFNKMIE
jgi:hypothetical protein